MLDEGVPFTVSAKGAARTWLTGELASASPDVLFRPTAKTVSEAEFRAAFEERQVRGAGRGPIGHR